MYRINVTGPVTTSWDAADVAEARRTLHRMGWDGTRIMLEAFANAEEGIDDPIEDDGSLFTIRRHEKKPA